MSVTTSWVPSVNLVSSTQYHLSFLKTVSKFPLLHGDNHLNNAVQRYTQFWLPLLGKFPSEALEAPLDVHWVWHCHLLSPQAYHADCTQLLGMVPDHMLRVVKSDFDGASQRAKELWEGLYPDEPYYIDFNAPVVAKSGGSNCTTMGYNLGAACRRQSKFYYNVSLPHYNDTKFLMTAVDRYVKFLNLKKNNTKAFIVPMYDVDLIWHTHQLYPHAYAKDTTSLLGYLLNHDDETTDRSPGSKLATSDTATRTLWKETYGENFPVPGALYRGESPVGRLCSANFVELQMNVPLLGKYRIHELTLAGGKDKYRASVSMKVDTTKTVMIPTPLQTAKGSPLRWTSSTELTSQGLVSLYVYTRERTNVALKFTRRDGVQGSLFGKDLCKVHIDAGLCLQGLKPTGNPQLQTLKASTGKYELEAQGTVYDISPDRQQLSIQWGEFADYTIPEDIEQLWGPVELPRLPGGVANTCRVASHLIQLHGNVLFTVRVIHSLPLKMSVIQVFYKDKMMATSQLVGPEQLPTANQVSLTRQCVTLDRKKGERAMLIKNTHGDWGVITGQWTGFQRGKKGKAGCPGHLQAMVTRLTDNPTGRLLQSSITLMKPVFKTISGQAEHIRSLTCDIFGNEGVIVSMAESKVLVGVQCTEVAEMLAAVFSAAVLVLLSEPQPHVFLNKGRPTKPKDVRRGRAAVNRYNSYSIPFFLYCGYMEPMYTNTWIYWHHCHPGNHHDHIVDGDFGVEVDGVDNVDVGSGGGDGDAHCPWDPEGECDHSNDAAIAESGGDVAGGGGGDSSGAVCGGCGSCGTSGGGFGDSTGGPGGACGTSDGGGGGGCGATSSGCGSSCGSSCGGGCGGGCGG